MLQRTPAQEHQQHRGAVWEIAYSPDGAPPPYTCTLQGDFHRLTTCSNLCLCRSTSSIEAPSWRSPTPLMVQAPPPHTPCKIFPQSHNMLVSTPAQEHQQHRGAVLEIAYSPDGTWLYSAGEDGGLCVYDVVQSYRPTKYLSVGAKGIKVWGGGAGGRGSGGKRGGAGRGGAGSGVLVPQGSGLSVPSLLFHGCFTSLLFYVSYAVD